MVLERAREGGPVLADGDGSGRRRQAELLAEAVHGGDAGPEGVVCLLVWRPGDDAEPGVDICEPGDQEFGVQQVQYAIVYSSVGRGADFVAVDWCVGVYDSAEEPNTHCIDPMYPPVGGQCPADEAECRRRVGDDRCVLAGALLSSVAFFPMTGTVTYCAAL